MKSMSEKEIEKEVKELDEEIQRLERRRGEIAKKLEEERVEAEEVSAYDIFIQKVTETLKAAEKPLTWTEIKNKAGFTQKVPNNVWVRKMEKDIGLTRERIKGKVFWRLK